MNTTQNIMIPLFEKVEAYGRTSFELIKLKSIAKTADVTSSLASQIIFGTSLLLFFGTLTMAIGFWLGEDFGTVYAGFLVLSGVYALVSVLLYFMRKKIKEQVSQSMITQMLN